MSARLPADFDLEATARLRGAFRRAREIKNAETLLRLALAYGGLGMSLRETCAWAEAGGIVVSLSDPSLLDRLCKAAQGVSGVLVVTNARATYTTRAAAGARHPAFPTPSLGRKILNASGASRREGGRVSSRHCL